MSPACRKRPAPPLFRCIGHSHPAPRAFAILAEVLLMQHTCHWYCRSTSVASARMLARQRTSYEQLVQAVLPQTRQAYLRLVK